MTDLPAAIARLTADDDSAYFEMVQSRYPATEEEIANVAD